MGDMARPGPSDLPPGNRCNLREKIRGAARLRQPIGGGSLERLSPLAWHVLRHQQQDLGWRLAPPEESQHGQAVGVHEAGIDDNQVVTAHRRLPKTAARVRCGGGRESGSRQRRGGDVTELLRTIDDQDLHWWPRPVHGGTPAITGSLRPPRRLEIGSSEHETTCGRERPVSDPPVRQGPITNGGAEGLNGKIPLIAAEAIIDSTNALGARLHRRGVTR